ncbi:MULTISPECIES: hypothetical protein [unclassified Rhizobium]|uniref:hypothetical protein n=1 Tax=unclassified Rhizobium TaxID=2613769 RepID=UPI000B0F1FD4|nr:MULTISPECIES: hypothetical protein [unclassified Rhizobium]
MAENSATIIYDVVSKAVLIEYRDKVMTLAGPWPSQALARAAAEDYCRIRGWPLP